MIMVSSRSQIKTRSGGLTASLFGVSEAQLRVGLGCWWRRPLDLPVLPVGVVFGSEAAVLEEAVVPAEVMLLFGEIGRGECGEWVLCKTGVVE